MIRSKLWTALVTGTLVILAGASTFLAPDTDRWTWLLPILGVYGATWVIAYHKLAVGASTVFIVAVLLRLAMLPLGPSLSDDAFRYAWDGEVQAAGLNPYDFKPREAAKQFAHSEELLHGMNSAEFYSIYPPSSQLSFRMAVALGGDWPASFFVLKLLFVIIELAGVIALLAMVAPRIALLYAWNPLVLVSVAGQAHTEALAAGMLLVGFLALSRSKPFGGGFAVALAGMAKLYPFLVAPIIIARFGWRAFLGGLSIVGVLATLYWSPNAIPNAVESLKLYVEYFEFNAGLYYAVKWLGGVILGSDISKTLGPTLAGATAVWFIAVTFVSTIHRWSVPRTAVWLFGGYIIFATTVHPWYLVPLLACVAANGRESWHWQVLAVASLGTYARYVEGPYGLFVAIGWIGFATTWVYVDRVRIVDRLLRLRARQKARILEQHIPVDAKTLLDLGAAEGYVGLEMARRRDLDVTLADVEDANRTDRPLVVYDGTGLPFDTDSLDVVVLSFVLHHAEDPDQVLAEATRVARQRVLILESVYRTERERRILCVADRLANRLRGGWMRAQEDHLTFRTAEEWERGIGASGGRILDRRLWGGFWHRKALFAVDVSSHEIKPTMS